jgi:type I restriction enzyme, S subunit
MSPEPLLTHFDRISNAPDAISRLRRFILDLAVRGKLVEPDPADETACELLDRIRAEKAQLVKQGKIPKQKPLPPIKNDEVPFKVPSKWCWVRLNDITSYIQRGKSPRYASDDGSPVVSQKCVQWQGLELESAKRITRESIATYEDIRFLRDGDLLWNSTGTGTIGRIVRVKTPPSNLVCDSHVTVVRCLEADAEYVRSWLRSDNVYGSIEVRAAGSTNQVELTSQMAISQVVPLPPLAEQRRVVAKVDEMMALCDQLEAAQAERETRRDTLVAASHHHLNNRANAKAFGKHSRCFINHLPLITARLEHVKQLRQTVVNLAVRGMLVPQDCSDEPASQLVRRIQNELDPDRKRETVARLPDGLMSAEQLPTSWRLVRIGVITKSIVPQRDKPLTFTGGIPWVTLPNFRDGKLVLQFDEGRIGLSLAEVEQYRLRVVPAGSVLMSCVGRFGITALTSEDCIPNQQIHAFCFPGALLDGKYLCYTIVARREYLESQATATTISYLNKSRCEGIPVALPPLAEQRRIVAKVDELMALCDRLEAQLTTVQTESSRLLESVLYQALQDGPSIAQSGRLHWGSARPISVTLP